MKITKEHWKEFDKIGISRDLVSEQEYGIWFKTVGGSFCATYDQKKQLLELETRILADN